MKTALWSLALSIAFAGLLAFAIVKGEPSGEPFSEHQKTWLVFNRPGGHFVGDRKYVFCDQRGGGYWVEFYANGNFASTARPCWLHLLPHTIDD